ncbi:MAG: hypothetical protein J2P15_06390, partial [Micromonosporaceae bacterium]|nr:hypothetical protein [Micromonosporaceae bacterium]
GSASAAGDASAGLGSASAAGDASAGLGSASAAGSASAGLVPASAAGSASAGPDPVGRLRDRIRSLLGLWSDAAWAGCTGPGAVVAVGGRPLSGGIVAAVGALEIAVHGWDVSRARGRRAPVPAPLAEELLELAPVLVIPRYRPGRFAAAVPVPPGSPPGDRLVAFLGRQPD